MIKSIDDCKNFCMSAYFCEDPVWQKKGIVPNGPLFCSDAQDVRELKEAISKGKCKEIVLTTKKELSWWKERLKIWGIPLSVFRITK